MPQPIAFQTAKGTPVKAVSTASNNLTSVTSTGTNLFEISVTNKSAAVVYVKLYDKASAPVVASDVPVLTIPVAITSATALPVTLSFGSIGKRFSLGLAYAITGAVTDTDATNVAVGVAIHATYV